MLVSIALTAATVCTASACKKCLDETQWPETRDEIRDASVRDRDETLVPLETVSRPRRLDRDHIPARSVDVLAAEIVSCKATSVSCRNAQIFDFPRNFPKMRDFPL